MAGRGTFKTGADGNTVQARVEGLSIGDGGRSPHIQQKVGGGSNVEILGERSPRGQVSYDGGHLIANTFDGLPENVNMVGMLKDLNRGIGMEKSYYSFEQHIRGLLSQDPPPKIDIQIDLIRKPGIETPSTIQVQRWADGVQIHHQKFDNIIE